MNYQCHSAEHRSHKLRLVQRFVNQLDDLNVMPILAFCFVESIKNNNKDLNRKTTPLF